MIVFEHALSLLEQHPQYAWLCCISFMAWVILRKLKSISISFYEGKNASFEWPKGQHLDTVAGQDTKDQ